MDEDKGPEDKKWLEQEIETLRRLRDELRVQLNLAGKEARERFQAAEKSWQELEARWAVVSQESRASLAQVGATSKQLLRDIRDAYRRVRELL
jgi:hypothetical protein